MATCAELGRIIMLKKISKSNTQDEFIINEALNLKTNKNK